jgi:hypothetical protein
VSLKSAVVYVCRWEDNIKTVLKTDWLWIGLGYSYWPVVGYCEYGNETARLLIGEKPTDQLNDHQLLMELDMVSIKRTYYS